MTTHQTPNQIAPFSAADVRTRALARLSLDLPASATDPGHKPHRGDHILNPDLYTEGLAAKATPAAVLIPIVARGGQAHVLLTRRSLTLRRHAGQVAFPGGRIDPEDSGPADAALREAEEEIGLARAHVTPLGFLDTYLTHSGFRILPLVAEVHFPFELTINHAEVEEAFEVPMHFLMDATNHAQESRTREGVTRHFHAMPYGEKNIWGVTAGIIRNLHERLYA
jgi:8-oxo-dGTP pyrophosphatase MutT (NUDIX family)